MSRQIHIDSVSEENREQMMEELQITIEGSTFVYNSKPRYIYPLDVEGEYGYLPFAYARTCVGGPFDRPDKNNFSTISCKFEGTLREEQIKIKKEAISQLNKYSSSLIAVYTGCGKTCMSIYIATKIKLKTMIITHRIVLINQWKQAINKFCPNAKIQVLTAKSEMKESDFYIMNATNVTKHDREFYNDIGFVIVDEVHCIMAEGLSKCMQKLLPRYVMGLSATPYREDGLNILLDLYFGKNRIERKLFREHLVYKIQTSFKPTIELGNNGKINWSVILDSQAKDIERNEMIVRLVKFFPDRVFLILCKRIDQGHYLVKRFQEEKEDVTSLIGKQQQYEQKSRILVGTASKTGTGFDHPRLDALILASDIQSYFVQYLGRVFRRLDVIPIIFDIVDKNPILERHYKVRSATYMEHGGNIKFFSNKFPEFELV
jgi:superfamily II DNA or RNA helicase